MYLIGILGIFEVSISELLKYIFAMKKIHINLSGLHKEELKAFAESKGTKMGILAREIIIQYLKDNREE